MKFLHTMLRVGDLQRSIDFYTRHFGMTLRRTTDRPEHQYTLAFLGYGGDERETDVGEAEIELTYNYGVAEYDIGTAFGHLASACPTSPPSATACATPAARSRASPAPSRAAPRTSPSCRIPTATRSS